MPLLLIIIISFMSCVMIISGLFFFFKEQSLKKKKASSLLNMVSTRECRVKSPDVKNYLKDYIAKSPPFRDNERKAHKTGELGRGQGFPSWPGAPSPVSVSHAH